MSQPPQILNGSMMILGSSAITSGIQNGPSAFTSGIHIGLRNHWFLLDVRELECPRLDSSVLDLPNLGFGQKTDKSLTKHPDQDV